MNTNRFIQTIFILLFGITSCSKKNSSAPILILATNSDFGTYTAEILKTEGFNEFQTDSLSGMNLNLKYLQNFDIVILTKAKVTESQKKILTEFVNAGGNLIAFIPDIQLNELFGLKGLTGTISEGYIKADQSAEQCSGITTLKMQFHGKAYNYEPDGGKTIATLYADKVLDEGFPGVVSNTYGKGHTVAFLYNLPQSIVYTRQGNPLFAGIEMDGIPGLRGMDLFANGWLDTANNIINQADQQMTLLSHCIQSLSKYSKPLPRFWYFPDSLKCLVVLDNDGEDNNEKDYEPQFNDIDSMGALMTLYIKDTDKVSKAWVDKWSARGFEIAGHPDDTREAGNPVWEHMDSAINSIKTQIKSKYGIKIHTNVNHWFVWCGRDSDGRQDFAAQARLEEKNGIEMDANYAMYDIKSSQPDHYLGSLGRNHGNFTGSGLVMKYADAKGRTVNVYQRFNSVYDQQYNESNDPQGFYECFKGLMDRSLNNEIYSVISIKSHNNEYYFSKKPLIKMLEYAKKNGIPVWTAVKLLDFLKMKDESDFDNISWEENELSFNITSSLTHSTGLTFMLPAIYDNKNIASITVNGNIKHFTVKLVKNSQYAFVTVKGGMNYNIRAAYLN
jgi:hypothetical protein